MALLLTWTCNTCSLYSSMVLKLLQTITHFVTIYMLRTAYSQCCKIMVNIFTILRFYFFISLVGNCLAYRDMSSCVSEIVHKCVIKWPLLGVNAAYKKPSLSTHYLHLRTEKSICLFSSIFFICNFLIIIHRPASIAKF